MKTPFLHEGLSWKEPLGTHQGPLERSFPAQMLAATVYKCIFFFLFAQRPFFCKNFEKSQGSKKGVPQECGRIKKFSSQPQLLAHVSGFGDGGAWH